MTNPIQAHIEQFELPHPSGAGSFQISVARHPHLAEGQANVPVMYVIDGDMTAGLAAEIARLRGTNGLQPTAMVVAIGYGVGFAEFAQLRTADLTPPLSEAGAETLGSLTNLIGSGNGGAEAFLTWLTEVLTPEIGRRYPEASATDRTLFGHSLGGLFVSYALLTRPSDFAAYVASSPSLWWDQFAVLHRLPSFADMIARLDRRPRTLICVGGKEQDVPTEVPEALNMPLETVQALVAASRMVDGAREFAASLEDAGADAQFAVFDGEDHTSVLAAALMRGLHFALS